MSDPEVLLPAGLFTPAQQQAIDAAARPALRAALRQGLFVGAMLGAVGLSIVLWLLGGGK